MNIELLFNSSNIKAYDSLSDHLSSLPYSYQTSSHLAKNFIKKKKNLTDTNELHPDNDASSIFSGTPGHGRCPLAMNDASEEQN
jgi:hypothetical protein